MITNLTNENFEAEVLKSDIPVLVDFWAPWCGPCRSLAPIIEEIEAESAGKLKVCKVNIDDNPDIAGQFGVMSIPTCLKFENGKPAGQTVGAMPKELLKQRLGL